MNKERIELVVFDMAGTTVNDAGAVHTALQEALKFINVNVGYDEINEVMGYPKPKAIEVLLTKYKPELCQAKVINEVHTRFVNLMIDHYKFAPGVDEKHGASDIFRILKSDNVKVAIDTGFSFDIASVIIDRLGWNEDSLIDVLVTSDQVDQGRPFPDMIFKAMKLTGVLDPNRVAKIGDTISDLQQGNAAGVKYVIGVTSGAYKSDELMKEKHTHLVSHLEEIIPIV
ncbi:MAG: HAD hydrolase-like protein, partial [Cyclobacteriaceae bacterium]